MVSLSRQLSKVPGSVAIDFTFIQTEAVDLSLQSWLSNQQHFRIIVRTEGSNLTSCLRTQSDELPTSHCIFNTLGHFVT